ncbi:unnamed protein product [Rhizoctonia solani]|uniref:Uncharacterized protein n=1 Tax=Rhizoctonia solani TaxID=456999 RepID=A0A8H3BWS5_9AGAM|nr:unnamed protein product [Rhizoctonia solani]
MSVVAPLIADGGHRFTTADDKEAMVQFWRSGLEYLAQGITAHHNITRATRICEAYSRRELSDGPPSPSLDAQLASHKENLESSVFALAELAASGLAQSSPPHKTRAMSSLMARFAALEDQMKGLLAIVQPLGAKLETLTGNVTCIESNVKSAEEKANATTAHLDSRYKELEGHVGKLSAQIDNPRPTQALQHEQMNKRLQLVEEKVQAAQGELEKQEKRIMNSETSITVLEGTRSRVDAQGTKLILLDGKVNGLQSDATDIRMKMRSLLTLAPEAKGLLSVPAQMKRAEQGVGSLKDQQENITARFNSFEASLGAIERKLEETSKESSASLDSLTSDAAALHSLKKHASSFIELPATLDQLRTSVAELAPLKLYSQDLTAVAGKASQLLELISHNERAQDDINQIRSKLARYSKDMADTKKESAENTRLLDEKITNLSSTNQAIQEEISGANGQMAKLQLSVKIVKEESELISARISGIDAKLKANQVTAQWSQEQIQTMRADIAYLEPLKGQREALLLLSGRIEVLMPLSAKFGSPEFQRVLKKAEEADAIADAARKAATEMATVFRDVQQRLNEVEPHVNQLESDISGALEKLTGLQNTSDTMGRQVKATMVSLQRVQNDVSPFLPFKSDILSVVGKFASNPSPVDEIQALKKLYASDITPMKGEIKKLKSISSTLRIDVDDAKGKISPLIALQQQAQGYQDFMNKFEERLAKLEPPLMIRIPPNRAGGGFSLSQSLNVGSSGSGPKRWKASTSNSPRKSSNTSSERPQSRPPRTPPPESQTEREGQSSVPVSGGSIKLTPATDDSVALMDKVKQVETEITKLSQCFNKCEKKLGELEDSVSGIDQLMTVVQGASNENSIALKLMEKEFTNLKEDNTDKLKEVDIKQARITIIENEIQRLKNETTIKLKAMEVTTDELAPLKEHTDILVALARPVSSPGSPAPRVSGVRPESRLVQLERTSSSVTKELKNLNGWVRWAEVEIKNYKNLNTEIQALDGHVRGLANSIATMNPLAASLTERASDLLGLLERPESQTISDSVQLTAEQLEGVVRAATRMKTLEDQIHALRTSQPKLKEDLDQVTSQVGELVPVVNKVVMPFTDHIKSILSLLPLSSHVSSLVPLVDQVPQLHASIQSLSDRVDVASSITQNPTDPTPASQLRSPVTDREVSPTWQSTDNTALFVPGTNEPRPNKRRRVEERFESLESQLDSIQGELDGVADDVKMLCTERAKAKRRANPQPAGVQLLGIQPSQSLEPGEVAESRKIDDDLDMLMDTLRSLFEGEGTWPERIDLVLGRQWAQALQSPRREMGAGASTTISKICNEIEALKSAIEAYGSGAIIPPSAIDATHLAWAESLSKKVMMDVGKEQAQFRTELEEVISRALLPVKKVFKALKDTSSDL